MNRSGFERGGTWEVPPIKGGNSTAWSRPEKGTVGDRTRVPVGDAPGTPLPECGPRPCYRGGSMGCQAHHELCVCACVRHKEVATVDSAKRRREPEDKAWSKQEGLTPA